MDSECKLELNDEYLDGFSDVGFKREGLRRWPDSLKAKIVAESYEPGVSVKSVAARYGLRSNLLSTWRGMVKDGSLQLPTNENVNPGFVPLVADDVQECVEDSLPNFEGVEIQIGKSHLSFRQSLSIEQVTALVKHLNGGL